MWIELSEMSTIGWNLFDLSCLSLVLYEPSDLNDWGLEGYLNLGICSVLSLPSSRANMSA